MRKIIITAFAIGVYTISSGQNNELTGQYFQNLPAYSPALTGMNDHLDITVSGRKQWAGFNGSPQNAYLSAYGVLHSAKDRLRLHASDSTDASGTSTAVKHGVGGYVMNNNQGPYRQTEVSLVYALHVPVFNKTFLSLGLSPSLHNARIDMGDLTLKDQDNDNAYLGLTQNGAYKTFFQLNAGLALYSSNYYVSYSIIEAAKAFVSGNKNLNDEMAFQRHQIIAGYRFYVGDKIEIMPNGFLRLDRSRPALVEFGARVRYNKQYWAGLAYRNDNTALIMVGVNLQDKWRVGYTYEYKSFGIAGYSGGTHEIVLGVRLFNFSKFASMW